MNNPQLKEISVLALAVITLICGGCATSEQTTTPNGSTNEDSLQQRLRSSYDTTKMSRSEAIQEFNKRIWVDETIARPVNLTVNESDDSFVSFNGNQKWRYSDVVALKTTYITNGGYYKIWLIFNSGARITTAIPPDKYIEQSDLIDGKHKLFYAIYVLCQNAK